MKRNRYLFWVPCAQPGAPCGRCIACDQSGCPSCGSDEIEGGFVQVDAGSTRQKMFCNNCDTEWTEYYILASIQIEKKEERNA